ncbi:hypothetical protein B14911_09842 [Bacillus sp. NRRL B-14911]|nr:hypothetical protein B14911_09842 [Bacillus sp. NRRL B-14911]
MEKSAKVHFILEKSKILYFYHYIRIGNLYILYSYIKIKSKR